MRSLRCGAARLRAAMRTRRCTAYEATTLAVWLVSSETNSANEGRDEMRLDLKKKILMLLVNTLTSCFSCVFFTLFLAVVALL